MPESLVAIEVSPKQLSYQPGGMPRELVVTVLNLSDRLASFQLDLQAAGAEQQDNELWYYLEPEISAKIPPGATTQFQVTLIRNPVPGFVGQMDLLLRIFSVDLVAAEARQLIRLVLEPGSERIPIKIQFPVNRFQNYPGQTIEISVQIVNPTHRIVQVSLQILGLIPTWFANGTQQYFALPPQQSTEIKFICQPPLEPMPPSQVYPFTIRATYQEEVSSEVQGNLEILPMGTLNMSFPVTLARIPAKRPWLPQIEIEKTTYGLDFDNQSNLPLQVNVTLQPQENFSGTWTSFPENVSVNSQSTAQSLISVKTQRRWLGRVQRFSCLVTANQSERRIKLSDNTQLLKLEVFPKIPLWLGGLGLIILLGVVYYLSWLNPYNPFWYHKKAVTSVQFNGRGSTIISGSLDQTIREWDVDGFLNILVSPQLQIVNEETIPSQSSKAVRTIRYRPVDNNVVAAALENGEIQLWNLLEPGKQPESALVYNRSDRVLDMRFTSDSLFLDAGYGSGWLVQWALEPTHRLKESDVKGTQQSPSLLSFCQAQTLQERSQIRQILNNNRNIVRAQKFNFAIYSLAWVDENYLAIAGQFNKLFLTNRDLNQCVQLPSGNGNEQDYIYSLAVASTKPLLATADSQGNLSVWNLQECLKDLQQKNLQTCQNLTSIDSWPVDNSLVRATNAQQQSSPVRSVALSADGCYLVSGGGDGRVMLWPLNSQGKSLTKEGEKIYPQWWDFWAWFQPQPIYSVDLKVIGQEIWIVSGGGDRRVNVYSHARQNEQCGTGNRE